MSIIYINGVPTGGSGNGDMLQSVYDKTATGRVDGADTLPTETYSDGDSLRFDLASGKMLGIAPTPLVREVLLSQFSTATSQEPTALDTPIRIEFGSASGTPSDPVQIDATGLITFNQKGSFFVRVAIQYGRTTSTGEVELFFRTLVNGVSNGNPSFARLDDDDTNIPTAIERVINFEAGDTLEFEMIRDSANGGINNGGLFQGVPATAGWDNASCATIIISRLTGDFAPIISGGDVNGTTPSVNNELVSYAGTTGKDIKTGSDVSILDGVIEKISTDSDLWLKTTTINDNVFIGRSNSTAGISSIGSTTCVFGAVEANIVVLKTEGNNSQSIKIVKQTTEIGDIGSNRDRDGLGFYVGSSGVGSPTFSELTSDGQFKTRAISNAIVSVASSSPAIELQDATGVVQARITHDKEIANTLLISKVASNSFISMNTTDTDIEAGTTINLNAPNVLVNGIKIGTDSCYVESTSSSTADTVIGAVNSYVPCNFGTSITQRINNNFTFNSATSKVTYNGTGFKGIAIFVIDVAHSQASDILIDCRVFVNNSAVGIWRQQYVPLGKTAQIAIDAYVDLSNGDEIDLRVKLPNELTAFNIIVQRTTINLR